MIVTFQQNLSKRACFEFLASFLSCLPNLTVTRDYKIVVFLVNANYDLDFDFS